MAWGLSIMISRSWNSVSTRTQLFEGTKTYGFTVFALFITRLGLVHRLVATRCILLLGQVLLLPCFLCAIEIVVGVVLVGHCSTLFW